MTEILEKALEREKAKVEDTDFYKQDAYDDNPKYDTALVRAEWLIYWMQWALQNCKHPVFVNS